MSEEFMLNSLLNFGAPTLICIATIKWLGVRVEKLTEKLDECINKMDKRLEKVENAIEDLKKVNR